LIRYRGARNQAVCRAAQPGPRIGRLDEVAIEFSAGPASRL